MDTLLRGNKTNLALLILMIKMANSEFGLPYTQSSVYFISYECLNAYIMFILYVIANLIINRMGGVMVSVHASVDRGFEARSAAWVV